MVPPIERRPTRTPPPPISPVVSVILGGTRITCRIVLHNHLRAGHTGFCLIGNDTAQSARELLRVGDGNGQEHDWDYQP